MHRSSRIFGVVLSATLTPAIALAQGHGGVGTSGMGQGEAQISTRADVRMSIESGPGTGAERLAEMSAAIAPKLPDIRRCYGAVTAERPQIAGRMRVRVELPNGRAAPVFSVPEDAPSDAELTRCVRRAVQAAQVAGIARPATAFVVLDFSNTAAGGAEEQARRVAAEAVVDVRTNGEGRLFAEGGTPTGEVRFTVTAEGATSRDAIAAMQRGLRAGVAGLLDCRRRSSRHGMNPEGELVVALRVPPRGRANVRVTSATVADERAPICVGRALGQVRFESAARGAARLVVRWTPQAPMDVPVRAE